MVVFAADTMKHAGWIVTENLPAIACKNKKAAL
jgi:hypothetical protein